MRQRSIIIIALLALLTVTAQGQIRYRLEGKVRDSTMNTKLLLYQYMSAMRMVNATIDTIEVSEGQLIPKEGILEEPGCFYLMSVTEQDEKPRLLSPQFFLEQGTTKLFMDLASPSIGADPMLLFWQTPTGSPLNDAYDQFINSHYPLLYGDSTRQIRLDSLMRSELARHSDDVLGMVEVCMLFSKVPPATVVSWLSLMSPRIKAGDAWNELQLALSAMGVDMNNQEEFFSPAVGEPFKDFTVEHNGKTMRLSDYVGRGKYVLIDFWASWCGPCRMEIPNLIAAYNKYKDAGLEVVGIAAWDKPAASLSAIEDDGVPYPQIINTQEIATKAYNIRSIPHVILFAPDGTILARGLRGEDIEQRLSEIFKDATK